jgi:hypothetical protein
MAATNFAMLGGFNGTGWANAFGPSTTGSPANTLDLLQIVDANGNILLNVTSAGVVNNPAVAATTDDSGLPKTRLGAYRTHLTSAASTASMFADAFTNPSNLDIVQIISPTGGSVVNYLDYLGVSH